MPERDRPEVLLHSLAVFWDLIERCLDATGARVAAEIGAEGGLFSERLAGWAARNGGRVFCVDPEPSDRLRRLARDERVRLIIAPSPSALAQLPDCGCYFVDGDHNYATVRAELDVLAPRLVIEDPALVVLHDVGWPCARRDQYYAPERLGDGDRHRFSYEGTVTPGEAGYGEHGLRGGGRFAYAAREGGERNGVRTAVEDFTAGRDDLTFRVVPVVFGLGFLYASQAAWAPEVDAIVAPFDGNPLLAAMEDERIGLLLDVLRLQDELSRRTAERARTVGHLQHEIAETRARALADEYRDVL